MVSQNKLIKRGIKYTDRLFKELDKRLQQGVQESDSLESFLEKTTPYTTNNPLVTTGYHETMLNLVLAETIINSQDPRKRNSQELPLKIMWEI